MKIRIIGDIHGKFAAYENIIKDSTYSIQIGDFGFKFEWEKLVRRKIDFNYHKIIPGNHDDYDHLILDYTFGKDYGIVQFAQEEFKFFFVRGAYSIDQENRIKDVSWWADEELSYTNLMNCIELYEKTKPEIMITHDCPDTISQSMFHILKLIPNRTSSALSQMFAIHKPKLWVFGHWHMNEIKNILGTEFICLNELTYIDIDNDIDIDHNIVQIKKQLKNINLL